MRQNKILKLFYFGYQNENNIRAGKKIDLTCQLYSNTWMLKLYVKIIIKTLV